MLLASAAQTHLEQAAAAVPDRNDPLYLPSQHYVRLVTLGYDSFASSILWFNTLSYFGKHYRTDQDYRWLAQMCDLVTSLDSRAEHVYEFCATLLSWVAQKPQESHILLTRAVINNPGSWRLRYLRGFNSWYFLGDMQGAQLDLTQAAALPQAPGFLASIASRLLADSQSPQVAIAFLTEMLRGTSDPNVRQALENRLKRAVLKRDLLLLDEALKHYVASFGSLPENIGQLAERHILSAIPQEPFGGTYFIELSSGRVKSSSGEKPLEFYGKTAGTGLMRGAAGQ
jgi:tetratricopeptide (TPR) repeat protein